MKSIEKKIIKIQKTGNNDGYDVFHKNSTNIGCNPKKKGNKCCHVQTKIGRN